MNKIKPMTVNEIEKLKKQFEPSPGFTLTRQETRRLFATLDARDALLINLQTKLSHEIDKAYNLAIAVGEHYENEKRLKTALETFIKIADEAYEDWDKDRDSRVGKILAALSGYLTNYRADITEIHTALALTKTGQAGEAGGEG